MRHFVAKNYKTFTGNGVSLFTIRFFWPKFAWQVTGFGDRIAFSGFQMTQWCHLGTMSGFFVGL